MHTRSNFYQSNSTATIPRRSNRWRIPNIVEPEIHTIAKIVPMADRTMEELLQERTKGYGEAIVILEILAENFEIKTNLLQLVQANKFHSFERDNPHTHISNFKRVTATLKYRDVPNDAIKLMLFPYSLEGAARIWYEKEPPNSILTWDDLLADQISNLVKIVNKKVVAPAKAVEKTCVTCGGAHAYYDCIATDSNQPSVYAATGSYNQLSPPNRASHQIPPPGFSLGNNFNSGNNFQNNQGYRAQMNSALNFQNQGFQNQPFSVPNNPISPSVPNKFSSYIKSNEIMIKSMQNLINVLRVDFNKQEENLRRDLNNDMRSILRSFFQNQPSTSGTLPSNTVPNTKGEMKAVTTRIGLAYEGPSIPANSPLEKVDEQNTQEILDKDHSNSSGSTAQVQPPVVPILIPEPDALSTQTKPIIPYLSRLNDQKLRDKATNQMEKFFQIFHDLHFDISFADAPLLMPKFASTIKSLLANKNKLSELAKVLLNENCSAMLLKKLLEKLGDLYSSITRPKGVVDDVFVKVGKFHFLTDFIVVDFKADQRVPLILGRSFLRTGLALIDVYGEEITHRVNDESITFNLNQTMRYSLTYDDTSMNRVDVNDIACEDFVQDVLDFLYNSKSSSPTLVSDASVFERDSCKGPIVKSSSPTLTPLGESDFFLEEIKDFLNDDSIPTGIKNSVYDPDGDILFLEKLLNEDPFQLPPMDLKLAEESKVKYSVKEPLELELKELPSHLEYAFLEDSNKLPVIIAKNLKDVERETLINILKSHKRAIAWKIFDIKVIDSRFCTYKILMEGDYKPAVQSQRRVNPKIHDVIKKEVIKLHDASMIYPISDNRGVCIDYRKLNDATRKDHFSLPFIDWMLERLAGNKFCCFLKGFLGYFQIPINPQDQEKTTFTCPYGTFAYRRVPFGLCNAPVFGDSFSSRLANLDKMPQNFKSGIKVDRAKVDVLTKLPHPTTVKGVTSFLGHASFYRRFIQDFSKIARPMTHLLEKETPFVFSKECIDAFDILKKKLTEAPILVLLDWNLPFELMCDASDYVIGVVLGQRKSKHFQPIHYASKTMTEALIHYSTTEKEMLTVVEAKALPTDDARVVVMFLKSLFSRFATTYHPQKSGQVEVSNLGLKRILERTVGENRASWAYWALKHVNFDLKTTGDYHKLQLNKLSELRDQAYKNSMIYKERTKKLHDSKIKNHIFNIDDQVLLFNSRHKIFSGKLKTRWSGPFIITRVFSYSTIELFQPNGPNFKMNGHRVKHYFSGDIPSNVTLNLHTFPMDN
uniref:Reverse transcriptase domain-containing protein n=1 Tax=Tanacetum cinerariifolium TaxID=118510 RepID=A0A6L2M7N7_TANCI|nr:reverse transcriptase domain-containing protein [Tanacetum cinerariifolium]